MRDAARKACLFDEYLNSDDPEIVERAKNWQAGIGLQDVDSLAVSDFLIETAWRNIIGEIDIHEAVRLVEKHHKLKRHFEGERSDEQD